MKSIIQDDWNTCFLCGRNGNADPLETHHIFGGQNRRLSDEDGLIVRICGSRCHRNGQQAAHRCKATAEYLHREGQAAWMRATGRDKEDFIRRYGKNYI